MPDIKFWYFKINNVVSLGGCIGAVPKNKRLPDLLNVFQTRLLSFQASYQRNFYQPSLKPCPSRIYNTRLYKISAILLVLHFVQPGKPVVNHHQKKIILKIISSCADRFFACFPDHQKDRRFA